MTVWTQDNQIVLIMIGRIFIDMMNFMVRCRTYNALMIKLDKYFILSKFRYCCSLLLHKSPILYSSFLIADSHKGRPCRGQAVVAQGNSLLDAWPGIEEAAGAAEVVEAGDVGIQLDKGGYHLVVGADRCVCDIAGIEDAALRLLMDRLPIVTSLTEGVEVIRRESIVRGCSEEFPIVPVPDIILGTSQLPIFLAASGDEHGDFLNPEPWGILPRRHHQSRGWGCEGAFPM